MSLNLNIFILTIFILLSRPPIIDWNLNMSYIPGYQIENKIYESANTIIFRGQRIQDMFPVTVKVIKREYPTSNEILRFENEYNILRSLNFDGVIKAISLEEFNQRRAIIFEDFIGEPIKSFISDKGFPVGEFLDISIQLTEILGRIHEKNIVHKDINPSNILLNPKTGKIKIIDFGSSTSLSHEIASLLAPNFLEGTLSYISPEQTGRMNRLIDYRTDFYSLGATFYHFLLGFPPFDSDDPLELIHAHIAKNPTPPHTLEKSIPPSVSDIIMKLLSKNAEDRYQTCQGLISDLKNCLHQWKMFGKIESFILAQKDFAGKLQPFQKLYGLEDDIDFLIGEFEEACEGKNKLIFISGYSGIGKTSLVHEIHLPIALRKGFFISGKFDQFQKDMPYHALAEALRELVQYFLTESEKQVQSWKIKLLKALGPNAQIVIDLIPELEFIIGQQPPIPVFGPEETQNRFNLVFQNFIKIFCEPEHPLVIFLDDLQWADSASLKLIQLLVADEKIKHLFIIGAYRDNELKQSGPLYNFLQSLKKDGIEFSHRNLHPLGAEHIHQWISDTLHAPQEQIHELVELVLQKTGGNPFFTAMFLNSLYTEKHLTFNFENQMWEVNLSHIQQIDVTDNVADLLTKKIKRFSDDTLQLLKFSSCLGNQVSIETISAISDKSFIECIKLLQEPIMEGILIPVGKGYFPVRHERNQNYDQVFNNFRFTHDKIRDFIYSMIEPENSKANHFRIGQYLLKNTPVNRQPLLIFEIVNQLNFGSDFVSTNEQKIELAQLNLKAGKKAKTSTAYESALNYFLTGIKILPDNTWNSNYELTLSLYIEAAEASYLSGRYESMENFSFAVFKNAKTLLDKIKIFEIKIQALNAQSKLKEAISTAKHALELLGINIPKKLNNRHIVMKYFRTRFMIAGKKIENLASLPEMKDPFILAAIRIMMSTITAAYYAEPFFLRFIVLKMVQYSLKYGNASESPVSYSFYGMILCGMIGDINIGHRFGNLAMTLIQQSETNAYKARTTFMVYAFIHHWKAHIQETLQPFDKAYQTGLETGDLEYASHCMFFSSHFSFFSGKKLNQVHDLMTKNSNELKHLNHETSLHRHEIFRQTVANLRGNSQYAFLLKGNIYDEEQMEGIHLQANDRTTLCILYFNKLLLCYIFGKYDDALKNGKLAEKYLDSVTGVFGVTLIHFFISLSRLALFDSSSFPEQAKIKQKVKTSQKMMKKWAHYAPMNHRHKYLLVEAEVNRILGNKHHAALYYDEAVKLAKQHGYIHEQAIANELAAKFYIGQGNKQSATKHLKNARYGFLDWGAIAKVSAMDETYDQILYDFQIKSKVPVHLPEKNLSNTTFRSFEKLDFTSVMKASQTISSEIVFERLLDKLMKIIMENAGAQKGVLILESNGKLMIEAELSIEQKNAGVLLSIPLEKSTTIPLSVVNYVARTQKVMVLNNAYKEGDFRNDPQIIANSSKSIFCGPILHKSRFLGVLYLENNLVTRTFNFERIEVIELLISQIAISLENARLYSNLEESELRYRQLYENIVDLVILINDKDQVIMANPRFYSTIGIPSETIRQREKDFKTWIFPDDLSMVQTQMLYKLHEGNEIKDFHFRIQNKTLQIFEVECNAKCIKKENELVGYQMVIRDITERKRLEKELIDSIKDVENARTSTILGLAKLAEYRDEATGAHLERIREYTMILTKELSNKPHYQKYITEQYISDIYFSSILHDIGKVGIPDSILLKPGALSREEFEVIKRHSTIGGDVLKQVNARTKGRSFLTIGMHIAYFHHEKWNGTGYPNGLKQDEIPLSARIVALADVYDALTSIRIYKEAYSHEKAREIIISERGKHFDPEVVDAFLAHESTFDKIRKEMQEEEGAFLLEDFPYISRIK
jgi:PAS domain S-box-containing protein